MKYQTNRVSYSTTVMPVSNAPSGLYEFQTRMYERVVNYSRSPPKGDYMTGGSPPKIEDFI